MKVFNSIGIFFFCLLLSALSGCRSLSEMADLHGDISSDTLLARYLKTYNVPFSQHNNVHLIQSGHEKFELLFKDIRQAEQYVDLEYFNFRNDSIAGLLFDILRAKAKEGVKVRAMFDDFGNKSNNRPLKKRHLDTLRAAGIDIIRFDPMSFPYIKHAFHRDHRKIVVIDGKIAYTGGMNVADYYITGLPAYGTWHDLHLRIEGEAVEDLHHIFRETWEKETGEKLFYGENSSEAFSYAEALSHGEKTANEEQQNALSAVNSEQELSAETATDLLLALTQEERATIVRELMEGAQTQSEARHDKEEAIQQQRHTVEEELQIAIVDRKPRDKVGKRLLRNAFIEMIRTAQDSITLISPYFVPTRKLRNALKEAAETGTELNVMISAKSDIPLTPSASLYVAQQLMKCGANVYLFNDGFHHSKFISVDGTHSTVGSANLNSRSLRYDYEVNAFLFDRRITLQIDSLFHADKRQSTQLTPEIWRGYSVWKRFGCWLANLLTPFL